MSFPVTIHRWATAQAAARTVRNEVFIVEQKVPVELEWDDMDTVSQHAIVCAADGTPVGTGRLLPDGHIGRMAVVATYRGQGIGSAILDALIRIAMVRGDRTAVLHAQRSAEGFYRRHGFSPEGQPFVEAGIDHIMMRRRFRD